jgi:hypothetical protein
MFELSGPSRFPIAASTRPTSVDAVNPHKKTHGIPHNFFRAGAASTFPRVDGGDAGRMIGGGKDEVSPVRSGWPFSRDREHIDHVT